MSEHVGAWLKRNNSTRLRFQGTICLNCNEGYLAPVAVCRKCGSKLIDQRQGEIYKSADIISLPKEVSKFSR